MQDLAGEPPAVGESDGSLRRVRSLRFDESAPAHALARGRQLQLHIVLPSIHRDRHAIDRLLMRSGEYCDEHRAGRIVPGRGGERTVGVTPFDVGQTARVEGFPGQEGVARKGRAFPADFDEPGGEGDQRGVGAAPVDRAGRVVLGVGVVVPSLAEAKLRPHRQHGRAARGDKQRQEIALVARAGGEDRRILGRPLDPLIPGEIRVGPVPVMLAVRLVVLMLVGNEVSEGEAVVRDDEVDPLRRRRGAREDVTRARHPRREIAARSGVAAPEAAGCVAEPVVPFGELGGNPPS